MVKRLVSEAHYLRSSRIAGLLSITCFSVIVMAALGSVEARALTRNSGGGDEPSNPLGDTLIINFFEDGYRTCACSKECDGTSFTCSVTSNSAQCGLVVDDPAKGCYCGSVGDPNIEYVTCAGGVQSKELPDDLQDGVHPNRSEFR